MSESQANDGAQGASHEAPASRGDAPSRSDSAPAVEPVCLVQDLRITYPGTKHQAPKEAVKGVSFALGPGEIVGCLGPNGAGKSSTIRAICGIVPPSAGRILACGLDVAREPMEAKRRIGFVAEDAEILDVFTAIEYFHFLADVRELPPESYIARAKGLLDALGLQADAFGQRLAGFSKGMKQKVMIAAAMAHEPTLLLLDEPLNGLDVDSTTRFKQLLTRFAADGGAVLYCSHLVDVMERFVPRVVIIHQGAIHADAPLPELLASCGQPTLELAFTAITRASSDALSATPSDGKAEASA